MSCGKGLAKVVAELRRPRRLSAQYAHSNTIPQTSMCLTRLTGRLDFGSSTYPASALTLYTIIVSPSLFSSFNSTSTTHFLFGNKTVRRALEASTRRSARKEFSTSLIVLVVFRRSLMEPSRSHSIESAKRSACNEIHSHDNSDCIFTEAVVINIGENRPRLFRGPSHDRGASNPAARLGDLPGKRSAAASLTV
jgi:hypothetical protein